ncbi:MAG TPA: RedB protein [Acidobacteriota bacterium]|nr:RedB protein [Acidobacteriota bacterium]
MVHSRNLRLLTWMKGAALAFWLAGIAAGVLITAQYQNSVGAPGSAPPLWPSGSSLRPRAGQFTAVMAVHPHCTCTRAGLEELARLMAQGRDRLEVVVLFIRPREVGGRWDKSDLWDMAGRIPDVTVRSDPGGTEARRFGARTSDHLVLYDRRGRLSFSGGITSSRGHSGDNRGRSAILSILGGKKGREQFFIFGCSLFGEET